MPDATLPPVAEHAGFPPGGAAAARLNPRGWWLVALLCFAIAFYALGSVVLGDRIYASELAEPFRAPP